MITYIFAHAGEEHTDTIESISHYLPWYIAIPVFIIAISIIGYLTWIVSGKKIDTVALVLAFVLLISGLTLFTVSPIISVISITLGIILAGALTFLGLTSDNSKK
jgi:hypothetical protein